MNRRRYSAAIVALFCNACALQAGPDTSNDPQAPAPLADATARRPERGGISGCEPVLELSPEGELVVVEYLCAPPQLPEPDPASNTLRQRPSPEATLDQSDRSPLW